MIWTYMPTCQADRARVECSCVGLDGDVSSSILHNLGLRFQARTAIILRYGVVMLTYQLENLQTQVVHAGSSVEISLNPHIPTPLALALALMNMTFL